MTTAEDELRSWYDAAPYASYAYPQCAPEQLAAVAKAYRVYYKKVPTKDGDYTMDHMAIVYLMDKNGNFVAPFSLKRKPEEGAAELRRYL